MAYPATKRMFVQRRSVGASRPGIRRARRAKFLPTLLCALLVAPPAGLGAPVALAAPAAPGGAPVDMATAVKQLEIVPCLLPARIRRLGSMSYPERRRLVEVTARDCQLKGGEYTFYDRAKPDSAAAFFKKLADDGNVDAQVSLGDVYQYLYPQPDYKQAAHWYRTAMENGSAKGQMQLARLYERGLGVPKDALKATNLWRQATGAGEELVPASALEQARTEADQRIAALTAELRKKSEEAVQVRSDLAQARLEISERKRQMAAAQTALAQAKQKLAQASRDGGNGGDVAALKDQVAKQQRLIDDQQYRIESLQSNLGVQQARLTASLQQAQLQNERLNRELERVSTKADSDLAAALAGAKAKDQQMAALQKQLEAAQAKLAQTSTEYQDAVTKLQQARSTAADNRASNGDRIAALEQAKAEGEAQLDQQRSQIETLHEQLAAVSKESQALKSRLDEQVHATEAAQAKFASTEAELEQTRAKMSQVSGELQQAQARLASLDEERSDLKQQLAAATGQNSDLEKLHKLLADKDARVKAQQARIGELTGEVSKYRDQLADIEVKRASYAMRAPVTPLPDTSSIRLPRNAKLGHYYALVIGNSDYEHLADLKNAANDASAVNRVLKDDYGVDSTLLLNATERQIFQAFQDLAKKTSEDDLVLIYYAGHGYEVKNESYWLPVEIQSREDAEVSGISSLKVARWLSAMPAKHVMVIADSCYSGSGIETTGGFRYSLQDLQQMLPYFINSKSRTMLTSGGDAPVMDGDGGGGDFSIFTKALIGVLKENRGILYGEELYNALVERVKYTPEGTRVNQTPTFGAIESAGHECGQFVLVRPSMRT